MGGTGVAWGREVLDSLILSVELFPELALLVSPSYLQ